ncbi:MAG TPA: hypothetical protein PLW77_00145 [Bacteroidales bacterium]|nr:hypothetical protein [Bacteroidales bacterium]
MKKVFLNSIIILVILGVSVLSCEKAEEIKKAEKENVKESEIMSTKSMKNYLEIDFAYNNFSHKFIGEKPNDMLIWQEKIGTDQERKSKFNFDYKSMPDINVKHVSDKVLILNINKVDYIFDYGMTKNYWDATVSTRTSSNIAKISMYTDAHDFNEMMDFYKKNPVISFNSRGPITWILAYQAAKIAIIVWAADRYCDAKVENQKNECIEKGLCYTVKFCGAECRECANNNN